VGAREVVGLSLGESNGLLKVVGSANAQCATEPRRKVKNFI
jgi:hypothetical protein